MQVCQGEGDLAGADGPAAAGGGDAPAFGPVQADVRRCPAASTSARHPRDGVPRCPFARSSWISSRGGP